MKEMRQILLLFTSLLLMLSAFALVQKEELNASSSTSKNISDVQSSLDGSASSCAATQENTRGGAAQVIFNGSKTAYSTFQDAFNAWQNGATLKLLQDANVKTLEISDKKTLDLNGHSLRGDGSGSVIVLKKNADLTLKGEGEIVGGKARCGGGIYGENAKLTLSGASVRGNSAKEGGGIHLKNCEFSAAGGAVRENQAETGGGIYLFESRAHLSRFSIEKNEASVGGGGVYLWGEDEDVTLRIENGALCENEAAEGGGGISAFSRSRIELLTGTEISKNRADCGGGMYLQGGHGNLNRAQAALENAVFSENSAQIGGGVNVVSGGVLYAGDSSIFDNFAELGGGVAISVYGEAVFSKTCTVTDNKLFEGTVSNVYSERSEQAEIAADFTGTIGISMPYAGAVGKVGVLALDGLSADEAERMALEIKEGKLYLRYKEQIPSHGTSDSAGSSGSAGAAQGGQGDKNVGIGNSGANAENVNASTKEGERAIAIMISISAACAVLFLAGSLVSRVFHRRQERGD